jgi:transposase-like protein
VQVKACQIQPQTVSHQWCDVLKYVYIKKVDMLKNRQPIRRFSESIKLKILAEITKGNYTKAQICDMYGIGRTTVNDWIRKYMRDDLMNHRVIIQTMEEQTKVQKLQKEITMLKELLLKKDLDALVLDSYLEVAAKDLGYKSASELKKKLDIKP